MRCVASAHRAAPRVEPCASRTLRLTNIPFGVRVADVAHGALAALASGGNNLSLVQCVTRVAVGDFTHQGVTEWDFNSDGLTALPPPYVGADVQTPRRPRDVGKQNRGFAVLCFASRAAAAVAASALEALPPGAVQLRTSSDAVLTDVTFRVEGARLSDGRLYLREDLARRAEEVTAAAAAQDAKRAARAPHRRRQKERDRVARDARLSTALLHAAGHVAPDAAAEAPSHGDVEALWRRAFSEWRDPAHAKAQLGAVDWAAMPDEVDPCRGGGLGDTPRGLRKRLQVESFLAVLRQVLTRLAPDGRTRRVFIYDMGCGTGNLCLPLAHALPHCTWVAVDAKQDSIARCAERARRAGLTNVMAMHGDIVQSARQPGAPPVDIAMGLHVCGSGTDLVLDVATSARAVFVVSPCCVGKMNVVGCACGPKSALIRARLATEEFSILAAAADFAGDSHVSGYDANSPTGALPRASKAVVEFDRAAAATEKGYTVHLVKLLHPEACVRNDLLVGWPASERGSSGDMCGDLFLPPAGVDTQLMAV